MNIWADIFLLLAQREPEDGDNALKKILPLLVIMLLYGLSGLLKGKKPKKPSLPTEAQSKYKPIEQAESAQQQRLPSYARKRPEQVGPVLRPTVSSPTRVPGAPPPQQQLPARRTMPTPARPTQPTPVSARPIEIQVPAEQHPTAARKPAPAAMAAAGAKKSKYQAQQVYEKRKMRDVAQTAQQVQQKVAKRREIEVPTETSRDKLLRALQQSNEAARGIVYAEILGKPLALREGGIYEF